MEVNHKRIIRGFLWQYGERFSVQAISFLVTIVLARLLMPEEYGIVSIALILTAILEVFVTSGLGNALVQKKDVTSCDYSSVLYFNIVLSFLLFLIVASVAPLIGTYYGNPKISLVIRLLSIRIIIASFNTVQQAYVQRNLLFRRLFYSSLGGTITSAILGIGAAYLGYGIYALVIQYLSNAIINTLILFLTIDWKPSLEFSWQRMKQLISYGWKILCSGLLNTLFAELKSIVIGVKYTSSDLAYYDRGKQFPSLIYENINTSIGKVLFPTMSQNQDDITAIKRMVRLSMSISASVLLPVLAVLFAVADVLIEVLLTSKWLPAVPFLRVTCLTYAFVLINTVLTNAINAYGRSDLHLKAEATNIISGIVILFLLMNFGTIYIALSVTISNIICAIVRLFWASRLFKYKLKEFINDYILPLCLSCLSCIVMAISRMAITNEILALVVLPIVGITSYALLLSITNKEIFNRIFSIINNIRK